MDHDIDPDAPDDYTHFDEFGSDEWPETITGDFSIGGTLTFEAYPEVVLNNEDLQILMAIGRAFPDQPNPQFQTVADRDAARRLYKEFQSIEPATEFWMRRAAQADRLHTELRDAQMVILRMRNGTATEKMIQAVLALRGINQEN